MSEGKNDEGLPKDHEDFATGFSKFRTTVHEAQDSLGGKSRPLNTKKRYKPGSVHGWEHLNPANPKHKGSKSKPGNN